MAIEIPIGTPNKMHIPVQTAIIASVCKAASKWSIKAKNANDRVTKAVTTTERHTYHTKSNINGTIIHHGAAKKLNKANSSIHDKGWVNGSNTDFKTSFTFRKASSTPAVNSRDCGNDGQAW